MTRKTGILLLANLPDVKMIIEHSSIILQTICQYSIDAKPGSSEANPECPNYPHHEATIDSIA